MSPDQSNTNSTPETMRVAVLGSTGSIGTQTLDTITHLNMLHKQGQHPTHYEVVALAAGSNTTMLSEQSAQHPDALIGVSSASASSEPLDQRRLIHADDAPTRLVEETRPDLVVGAIVGIAGLASTLRSAELGINLALANKESLVAAGHLVTHAATQSGASILPVDSEHAGLWQCMLALMGPHYTPPTLNAPGSIRKVTLTASGGPFRDRSLESIEHATLQEALDHPTWSMGKKVSIDSATLMNKALELIEARWLFGLDSDQLDAVIHPQSAAHAFLETEDGSIVAHLGPTDMRCAIQHALTHPDRASMQPDPMDLARLGSLDFRAIDPDRFPAIGLAKSVIARGGSAGAVFNAANEAAVEAFLRNELNFGSITRIVSETLESFDCESAATLDEVLAVHQAAKDLANTLITKHSASRA
ncbi:MAG: 1-deoxy-D-xylulose-5-phosphate reductoisomerase [Phycisphaerales bacterium]|nr:1-deoxy-D-xylulose-5-phosphate reductoisomerase [Phycisphaerales bacterium]